MKELNFFVFLLLISLLSLLCHWTRDEDEGIEIRKAIHVGSTFWNNGFDVHTQLIPDVMKSVRPWLEELLEHYRVLIYNGQLDIIVAYPLTVNYIKKMIWSGAEVYRTAPRYFWIVDGKLAGYVKHAGKLTEAVVLKAGHLAPEDQPKSVLDLITRFIHKNW